MIKTSFIQFEYLSADHSFSNLKHQCVVFNLVPWNKLKQHPWGKWAQILVIAVASATPVGNLLQVSFLSGRLMTAATPEPA